MYEDKKIKLIDIMQERNTIHYIWTRLFIQTGKEMIKDIFILIKGEFI